MTYQKPILFLSPAEVRGAVAEIDELARSNGVAIALAGGAALQLHGSPRMTADVDFLASDNLPIAYEGPLSFGGLQGRTSGGVPVDLIIRTDEWQEMYTAALEYARPNLVGAPVVQPEHMVALKLAVDRAKDVADLEWLMLDAGIDYARARDFVVEFMGKYAGKELDKARDYMLFERSRHK